MNPLLEDQDTVLVGPGTYDGGLVGAEITLASTHGPAVTVLQATPFVVTLIVGHVIPIATALVTKSSASSDLKRFVTAAVSAASAYVMQSTLADGSAVFTAQTAVMAVAAFISANVAYVSWFAKKNINDRLLPGKGLGGS